MKISSFYKFIGMGAIAASLAVMPLTLPAQAQNATQPNSNVDKTGPIAKQTNRGDTNDIGWFGIIGLVGLAGLAAKNRRVHYANNDPNARVRTDSE